MKTSLFALLAIAGLALVTFPSIAGSIVTSEAGVTWKAGVNGVSIESGADGNINRIYSEYSQAVSFPDRRGISRAQVIAEEKAKAAIVRFLKEGISQERTIASIDAETEDAVRQVGGQGEGFSRESQRNFMESLTEITRSYAKGELRGVIVLEKGYNEDREEAWVKVGISRKTLAAASSMKAMIADENPQPPAEAPAKPAKGPSKVTHQPSEVTTSESDDW